MTFYRIALAAVTAAIGASSVANAQATDWASRINVNGDLRFRYQRDLNGAPGGVADNYFPRIRARLGVNAKVNDQLMANFRLATSTAGNTQNQTLNAAPYQYDQKKPFMLDLGYFDYKINEGLNLQVGKTPNLFWAAGKNEMVWNSTWTHEGVQAKWWGEYGSLKPFATVNWTDLYERNGSADVTMFGAQAGLGWKMDPMWATVAVGSYNYVNLIDAAPVNANGNSLTAAGNYANDYKLLNAGLEVGYNLGFAPLAAYVDYVTNSGDFASGFTGNKDLKNALIAGLKLGTLTAPGSWFFGGNYREVQKDSVFGYAGDAGFIGGGADVRGAQYQVGYQAWANAALGLTYENGTRTISTNGTNYESYYLDLVANF